MKRLLVAALLAASAVSGALAQAPRPKITIATGVDPSLGTFYVAKVGGFFEKNGLDVQLNTGPSGSAMVAFLVQNQVQAVLAAEQAGIQNFNLDNNVNVSAQAMQMLRYFGVVGRNIATVEGLKGKKVGVALGSASEVFWRAFVDKLGLNPKDYTVIHVEPPEMLAALERGNIDAFAAWEPWLTRTVQAVANTKIIRDNEGIINPRNFVYINRGWAQQIRRPRPCSCARLLRPRSSCAITPTRRRSTSLRSSRWMPRSRANSSVRSISTSTSTKAPSTT